MACVCTHMYACMHDNMYTYVCTYIYICVHVCVCMCVRACVRACVRTCVCVTVYWEGRSDVIKRWYNFILNIHNLGNVQDMYM